MGRGNWCPSNEMEARGCRFILVGDEKPDPKEEYKTDPDDHYWFLRENITDFLMRWNSWKECSKYKRFYFMDDVHIFAENELFEVFAANNETTTVICIAVKEFAPAFAAANLEGISRLLFNHIAKYYKCRVRTSAWTSEPYKMEE